VTPNRYENTAFLVLFAGASLILFFVFWPFIQILTLAAVLANLFHSPFEEMVHALRGRRTIAALCVVFVVCVFIIAPMLLLGTQMFWEAQGVYQSANSGGHFMQAIQNTIEVPIQRYIPEFTLDLSVYARSILGFISNNLASFVSQAFFVLFYTFLLLLTFFFFLRDGKQMIAAVSDYSPFSDEHTAEILGRVNHAIDSIIRGTFFVALIRWFLIGVGFFMFGIQDAVLWSSIGGLVGAIPGLGTPFVFVPAVLYLYVEGNTYAALGLATFGVLVLVVIDNVLGPYFFSRGLEVQPVFVLLAILGGILFFGPLGFILGPIVLSVFLAVVHMYRVSVLDVEQRRKGVPSLPNE
jgi:predicted PurR-regulated permease PerM